MASTQQSKARPRKPGPAQPPIEPVQVPHLQPDPVQDSAPVVLDLDTIDKFDVVEDAVTEVFTIRHRGHVFELCDPRDLDWKDIFQAIRNPVMFMRYAIAEDQQDVFYGLRLEAWKLNLLMERWHQHYKMPNPTELAKLISG